MEDKRRAKGLSLEDRELWRRVTESVTPLRPVAAPAIPVASPGPPPGVSAGPFAAPPRPPKRQAPPPASPSPALPPLDRRLTRRIGRGTRDVDAVIDLHGLTQREAHGLLLSFLQGARAAGHRLVLVVTGKGGGEEAVWWDESSRGVLRRAVPDWLATPQFRPLVVGFEQAHRRKGGEGAIYVQVRRADRGADRGGGRGPAR